MNRYNNLMIFLVLFLYNVPIRGMEVAQDPEGPMDSTWFYNPDCVASVGNKFYQQQKWVSAAIVYENFLNQRNTGVLCTDYDVNKVKLNLALCKMASGQATSYWISFDRLLGIGSDRCLLRDITIGDTISKPFSVFVDTKFVGIGDIWHFLSAVDILKKRANCEVTVSVPHFLKDTLACAAQAYGFTLIGTKDVVPKTDYETHLISLLGHLRLAPVQLNPEKVVFTAPERARNAVLEQIAGPLALEYIIAAAFPGENRQAKLIGGKKLPNDAKSHGRHLNSESFEALLNKHSNLVLIDCGTKVSRITIDKEVNKKRCLVIPDEKQAFDTIIALASIMNEKKQIIGIGADNGPTNVFVRSLDNDAQDRMALIIPNPQEYDARMENYKDKGDKYKQMISNSWTYKCESPSIEHQIKTIERAYQDLTQ